MAWEDRNGRMYYYRKRRQGNRVVSEYMGSDLAGQFAEILDLEDRQEADHKRRELGKQKRQAAAIDTQADEVEQYGKLITRAYLLLAGYHTHKGQWRKIIANGYKPAFRDAVGLLGSPYACQLGRS